MSLTAPRPKMQLVSSASLIKAASTIRHNVAMLVAGLKRCLDLHTAIEQIRTTIAPGCRMSPRRKAPNAYQLPLNLPEVAYA